MADQLASSVVKAILSDPALVAELRAALLSPEEQRGHIGHHQAAERWGVAPETVARWCRTGLLDGVKLGRVWLVDPAAPRPKRQRAAVAPAPAPAGRRRPKAKNVSLVEMAMRG